MRKVSIDLVKANIFALVLLFVSAVVFLVPFFLIWRGDSFSFGIPNFISGGLGVMCFLLLFAVGIAVHEFIHGMTWACCAKKGWKSISFGVIWKMLTPYCHCSEPLQVKAYVMGALMPCILLGIIPSLIGLFIGWFTLMLWGILFISVAAGDIWIVWLLSKETSAVMVLDHPSEAGFYVIE